MSAWQNALRAYRSTRAFAIAARSFLQLLGAADAPLDDVELVYASRRVQQAGGVAAPARTLAPSAGGGAPRGVPLRGLVIRVRGPEGKISTVDLSDATRVDVGVPDMVVYRQADDSAVFRFNLNFVENALTLKHAVALKTQALITEGKLKTMCIASNVETTILLQFAQVDDCRRFQQLLLDAIDAIDDTMPNKAVQDYDDYVRKGKCLGL